MLRVGGELGEDFILEEPPIRGTPQAALPREVEDLGLRPAKRVQYTPLKPKFALSPR